MREDEADLTNVNYKPGPWHHSLDDPHVFEDELQALQARVDARVSAARKSTPSEDAKHSSKRSTSQSLEARVAAARASLALPAEDDEPSSDCPHRLDQLPLSSGHSGGADVPEFQANTTCIPQPVQLPSMPIQPPELVETMRAGSQEPGNEMQPTQSLCYSRSLLSEQPAGGYLNNSVLNALETKGEHNCCKDGDYDCTMLVLERALTGGA